MIDCTLCAELDGKEYNNLCFLVFGKKINRILKETDNFVVIPTIGHFVDGYLLIISKKHFISMGSLPKTMFSELKYLIRETKKVLYNSYDKKTILFEHGAVGESFEKRAGCCTVHMHLHVVPVEIDLLRRIKENYCGKEIISIESLCEYYQRRMPYLFYEDNNENKYVFEAHQVVSQYFRQILALELGAEEKGDWRNYYGKEELLKTLEQLSFWRERK